jgi:uncharacterized protein YpmS
MKKSSAILIVMVFSSFILSTISCNLVNSLRKTPTPAPIIISTKAATALAENVGSAVATAISGGPIELTLTEQQLTSLAASEIQSQSQQAGAQIQDLQIHLRDGQIQITGQVNQDGFSLPLSIILTISVDAQGLPHAAIVSANVGPFPLPDSMLSQMATQVDQMISEQLNNLSNNLSIDSITIANGTMTIIGHTRK